jgi:hypothetical protein
MGIMKNFAFYLTEARWATEAKLTHLEHPEDHLIKSGEPGFHHAFNTLKTTAEHLQGHDGGTRIMTKFDGAPSIVFGHNPQNGKFFVASKSAFNKNPKLNYTAQDIEENHGHAPGLVGKLKAALEHLPKVSPRRGVYQGDFLYNKADNDVSQDDKNYHFKPQLIGYTAAKNSPQGQTIARSKIGLYVHTGYKGADIANMKANYTPDLSGFNQHPDVHLHTWDQGFDAKRAKYSDEEHELFKSHMNAAGDAFKNADRHTVFAATHDADTQEHLATFANKLVRTGDKPSIPGLTQHIREKHQKLIDAVKQEKTKAEKTAKMHADIAQVLKHQDGIKHLFKIQHHISEAKNALLPALHRGDTTGYKYNIQGNETGPEGFVSVTGENRPTKLINRAEFSRINLTQGRFQKKAA